MSNKLFVGNLAWAVTSEKLHEMFSAFGPVVEAKVLMDRATGRSRGFGFVTFQNAADADRATAEMNNREIEGRTIRCDNSQQQSDHRDRGPRENRPPREPRENREPREPRENRGYNREDRGYNREDRGYNREDRGYNREDRGYNREDRGYGRRDDSKREFSRREDRPRYDNYNMADFPPDPDKMNRNARRDNRRKDRNHDDDDRW